MSTDTIQDTFEHGLRDMYDAEHRLTEALDELESNTEREEIAGAFATHREQTQEHVERLEEVFEMLGEQPEAEECEGVEGLIEEYEAFVETDPDQSLLDYHNMAAAEKTEHYEIAAYGNLIPLAAQLGMNDAADLLAETLREEQDTPDDLKELTEQFDMDAMPAS